MTGAPDLTGRTVPVVWLSTPLRLYAALEPRWWGPARARRPRAIFLPKKTPTHAVLDLNLSGGAPRFEIAHLLQERGVPFVFLTGYDPDVIPEDLKNVIGLQKPVQLGAIVEAVSKI